MANITIVLGGVLILLGLSGYAAAEPRSGTALIPTYFGLAFLVLGLLALKDHLRKHAMHLAVMLGLFGLLGSLYPLVKRLTSGHEFTLGTAMQAVMAALCALYVLLGVRSFIAARRARAAREVAPGA